MIITNGKRITSTEQPEDIKVLEDFVSTLMAGIVELQIGKTDEQTLAEMMEKHQEFVEYGEGKNRQLILTYNIPDQLELKDILNAGSELKSINGLDIVEYPTPTIVNAKYEFTEEELNSQANVLADKVQELAELEDEKKEVMSQFKARIDEANASSRRLANNRKSGSEWRDLEVTTIVDFEKKKRLYKSTATGKIVKEEPLYPSDYQLVFNF